MMTVSGLHVAMRIIKKDQAVHINTTKTKVFRLDGWRSWLEPVNAVGGCNFTEQWHETATSEVDSFCKKLRQAKIKYRCVWGDSSNVFMKIKFICVHPDQRLEAQEIAFKHRDETEYFYNL